MAISDISDQEILSAVGQWGNKVPTYVVRNILSRTHAYLKTPAVLRRLKSLEKKGQVKRVKSNYAVMICWELDDQLKAGEQS